MLLIMKLQFLDRIDETARLKQHLCAPKNALAVLYGRRRCGKSTLLQQVVTGRDVYFLADQREQPLQINAFAEAVEQRVPSFAAATYPSWDAVFTNLAERCPQGIHVVLDEFPYLVQSAPELPSMIQRFMDRPKGSPISWILCGSSQRMMQGAVLDRSAPLYGRAREILRIRPLPAGWITTALRLKGREAIEAYALWGGIPRYWELATDFASTRNALASLVLDRNGVLHDEPSRLLQDEMRSSVQAQSLLSLIGNGCHRLSEIARRLGKPAGSLTRPLNHLIELGYVARELPWGENARSSKRTLYHLSDPFIRFYYQFMLPYKSLLELGRTDAVLQQVMNRQDTHTAAIWEELARESVPSLQIGGQQWNTASRWWGQDENRRPLELDVVAESLDRGSLLLGEVKWGCKPAELAREAARLERLAKALPFTGGRKIVIALWTDTPGKAPSTLTVITPKEVLEALR